MALPELCWALPQQSAIKRMPRRHGHGPIFRRHFLNWGSVFLRVSRWQLKLTMTASEIAFGQVFTWATNSKLGQIFDFGVRIQCNVIPEKLHCFNFVLKTESTCFYLIWLNFFFFCSASAFSLFWKNSMCLIGCKHICLIFKYATFDHIYQFNSYLIFVLLLDFLKKMYF